MVSPLSRRELHRMPSLRTSQTATLSSQKAFTSSIVFILVMVHQTGNNIRGNSTNIWNTQGIFWNDFKAKTAVKWIMVLKFQPWNFMTFTTAHSRRVTLIYCFIVIVCHQCSRVRKESQIGKQMVEKRNGQRRKTASPWILNTTCPFSYPRRRHRRVCHEGYVILVEYEYWVGAWTWI